MPAPEGLVTVYSRPGCPYCALLRRGLRRAGIVTSEVNIWDDPDGAATVRRVASGNETVPTVVVGGAAALVNPTVRAVRQALAEVAPALLPQPSPG
ncbi:MAG: glutaredoxin domain-containing protein, partial [Acidimicrobiales bacterium]